MARNFLPLNWAPPENFLNWPHVWQHVQGCPIGVPFSGSCLYDTKMPFWFTFWFPIANAVLTLILAGVTACFASVQHNLDKNRLRAELFDRRVAVYDAMKRFVSDIISSGTGEMKSLMEMLRETRHAQFLFKSSDDISGFIFHFYKQGVELKTTRDIYEVIRNPAREDERRRLRSKRTRSIGVVRKPR